MGHVAWKSRNMSFQPGCRSEIIAMITSATQLTSFPNSNIKSKYLTYLQMKKGDPGTWDVYPGKAVTYVSHLNVSLKSFL